MVSVPLAINVAINAGEKAGKTAVFRKKTLKSCSVRKKCGIKVAISRHLIARGHPVWLHALSGKRLILVIRSSGFSGVGPKGNIALASSVMATCLTLIAMLAWKESCSLLGDLKRLKYFF